MQKKQDLNTIDFTKSCVMDPNNDEETIALVPNQASHGSLSDTNRSKDSEDENTIPNKPTLQRRYSTVTGASANLVSTIFTGAIGTIANLVSICSLGIVNYLILNATNAVITYVSIKMLCDTAESSQTTSTQNLGLHPRNTESHKHNTLTITFPHTTVKHWIGDRGSLTTRVMLCLGNWAFMSSVIFTHDLKVSWHASNVMCCDPLFAVSCLQIFADFAPGIMSVWFAEEWVHSRYFVVFLGLCCITPFAFIKDLSALQPLSAFTVVLNVFLLCVLFANVIKASLIGELANDADFFVYDLGFFSGAVTNALYGTLSILSHCVRTAHGQCNSMSCLCI